MDAEKHSGMGCQPVPRQANRGIRVRPSSHHPTANATAQRAARWNLEFCRLEFIWDLEFWDLEFARLRRALAG
jgi:hypothetical protein